MILFGLFKMWAIEYVQVPIAKEKPDDDHHSAELAKETASAVVTLTKSDSNCSLAISEDERSVNKDDDGNDDSLKEDEDVDDESPTKVRMALNVALQQKRPSLVSAKSLHEQINNIVVKGRGKSGDPMVVIINKLINW